MQFLFSVGEAGKVFLLDFGRAVFFFSVGYRFDHKAHSARKVAHCLQALQILCDILCRKTVDHIPIGRGSYGHIADSKILVQHIKRSGVATSAAGNDRRADLHML